MRTHLNHPVNRCVDFILHQAVINFSIHKKSIAHAKTNKIIPSTNTEMRISFPKKVFGHGGS